MSKELEFKLIAKTFQGLEEVLAKEIEAIGAKKIEIVKRAVRFYGDLEVLYKANLYLRTALRVLMEVKTYEAENDDELYDGAFNIPWEEIFDIRDTFAVDAVIQSETFRHSKFTALRVKDAIADRMRKKFNRRPSVNVENPDIHIHVFISNKEVQISLDSSGAPLHIRGYKLENSDLPLFNEVLAAGLILLSGWNGEGNFVDPMCGIGTILIEAGMIAKNIAPGTYRKHFAFMNWNYGDSKLWDKLVKEARDNEKSGGFKLHGSDKSRHALSLTRKNLISARLGGTMLLDNCEFEQIKMPAFGGILMMNPPNTDHLDPYDAGKFYRMIGHTLESHCSGFDAWLLSDSVEGLKKIGLKAKKEYSVWNGKNEAKLLEFSMK